MTTEEYAIRWSNSQLREAGIKKSKLKSLVKRLLKCSEDMQEMGLEVYGSDGTGYLIHESRPDHADDGSADLGAIVADVGPRFNGGGW